MPEPIQATTSEPTAIPPRRTMYIVMTFCDAVPEQNDYNIRGPFTDMRRVRDVCKEEGEWRTLVATIPGTTPPHPPAAQSGEEWRDRVCGAIDSWYGTIDDEDNTTIVPAAQRVRLRDMILSALAVAPPPPDWIPAPPAGEKAEEQPKAPERPEQWPTSAETSAIAWPISTMDGADWNLLDATGTRIAICGFDADTKTDTFRKDSSRIAHAIVGMLTNLHTKVEVYEKEIERLERLTPPTTTKTQPEVGSKILSGLLDRDIVVRLEAAWKAIAVCNCGDLLANHNQGGGCPGGWMKDDDSVLLDDAIREINALRNSQREETPAPTPKAGPSHDWDYGTHTASCRRCGATMGEGYGPGPVCSPTPKAEPKPAEERVRWFRVKNAPKCVWKFFADGRGFFTDDDGTVSVAASSISQISADATLEEFTPDSPAPKDAESVGEDIVKRMRERHDFGFDRIWGEAADTIEALRSQLAAMTERAEANHPQRKGGA